jgi:hypothetical protein
VGSDFEGHGEHPLAQRDSRKDVIHEMGRLGIHATGAAAGAELTDLAGEGEELLAAAVGAVDAGEAVRRISAARKGGQLPLHEGRVVPATLLAGGPEGRSVALEDPVQDGTAWIAAKDRAAGSLGLELAYASPASTRRFWRSTRAA